MRSLIRSLLAALVAAPAAALAAQAPNSGSVLHIAPYAGVMVFGSYLHGPLNTTLSVAYDVYNQFGFGNYGYAAAMSYVLFLAIVLLTLFQFRLLGRDR